MEKEKFRGTKNIKEGADLRRYSEGRTNRTKGLLDETEKESKTAEGRQEEKQE